MRMQERCDANILFKVVAVQLSGHLKHTIIELCHILIELIVAFPLNEHLPELVRAEFLTSSCYGPLKQPGSRGGTYVQ